MSFVCVLGLAVVEESAETVAAGEDANVADVVTLMDGLLFMS